MILECFTCIHKRGTFFTQDERDEIKKKLRANGDKYAIAPECEFHCNLTGKKISQIDPACEDYCDDESMVDIRNGMSAVIKKMSSEITNNESVGEKEIDKRV